MTTEDHDNSKNSLKNVSYFKMKKEIMFKGITFTIGLRRKLNFHFTYRIHHYNCFQDHSYEVDHVDQDSNNSLPSSPMNSTFDSQHALRQAELGRQVQDLTKALAMKQELALKLQQNEGAMNEKMVKQYEVSSYDIFSDIPSGDHATLVTMKEMRDDPKDVYTSGYPYYQSCGILVVGL